MKQSLEVSISHSYPNREKLDSYKVGQRLLDLMKTNRNRLNHSVLLADAQAEDSPLHPAFEWHDGKAAEQYRIHQANTLVRSVTILIRQPESESPHGKPSIVQVSIVPEQQQDRTVYLAQVTPHAGQTGKSHEKRDLAQEILLDMRLFKRKYGEVGMVQSVIAAMDEVLAREAHNG